MNDLYLQTSIAGSKLITNRYSTSFSLGIRLFHKDFRPAIYSIYGFVRLADEIVDTFTDQPQEKLLDEFTQLCWNAIDAKFSTHPVLHSFQYIVNKYEIPHELIELFIKSMRMDLYQSQHNNASYDDYILGSAEVVGLMCLKVFVNGDQTRYEQLKPYAQKLGSAFQKINFLRDLGSDFNELGRFYFPNLSICSFNENTKDQIINEIDIEFREALEGIKMLPTKVRLGVYVAWVYYSQLLIKIKKTQAKRLLKERIRISNQKKMSLMFWSYLRHNFNLL